mmetsp:Transcript_12157/g.26136  ORF Transcript_12157/g.26136 Transcript_12157/m.26136 type:complete len:215 (+) Transcript_12157:81-725(+)|eukprot:CAMPEP_0202890678 /NCGR_PEP_ID=MMETSP1392-20130828/1002_1 /ASSEMBLY_ACC=CAM_ASM_000868 /TAXON_ID=225041 /ORGANISM="Chlamydomonas chlamydogama, Strain SAG 11-48b" /LENGTH=214 /DNA_ID=CAMNT_0049574293 /DNA_START=63 /DNA_END=707 /DNA_ORIENTATION=+
MQSIERTSANRGAQLTKESMKAVDEISKKQEQLVRDSRANIGKPSTDMMSDLSDNFHQANTVARQSAMQSLASNSHQSQQNITTASVVSVGPPKKKEKKKGLWSKIKKFFGGGSEKSAPNSLVKTSPTLAKEEEAKRMRAVEEISRRSKQVALSSTSRQSNKSAASTDLLGDITDNFNAMREGIKEGTVTVPPAGAPAAAANGTKNKTGDDVWD